MLFHCMIDRNVLLKTCSNLLEIQFSWAFSFLICEHVWTLKDKQSIVLAWLVTSLHGRDSPEYMRLTHETTIIHILQPPIPQQYGHLVCMNLWQPNHRYFRPFCILNRCINVIIFISYLKIIL